MSLSEAEKSQLGQSHLNSPKDGKSTQRQFDFTTEKDVVGDIIDQMDSMSQKQLKSLKEQMECIVKDSQEDRKREARKWFEDAVVPILRNFAETSCASLEILDEGGTVISATFQNKSGYDLAESDRHMRMLVDLSNYVSIEKDGDNIVLVLEFDCLDMK